MVFAADYFVARKIVTEASKLGMTEGDYCYIIYTNHEVLVREFNSRKFLYFYDFNMVPGSSQERHNRTKYAMDSVLFLGIKAPMGSQYKHFTEELKNRISQPPFNSTKYLGGGRHRVVILSFLILFIVLYFFKLCLQVYEK